MAATSHLPPLRPGHSPLVGRAGPLGVLAKCLEQVQTGRGGVVMMTGAPGIGKTRLIDEFFGSETARSATVLRGEVSLAEGMPPYMPFLEALGDYVSQTPPEIVADQVGSYVSILATLIPQLSGAQAHAHPAADAWTAPEQQRFRLYEAVAAFLGPASHVVRGSGSAPALESRMVDQPAVA